TRRLPPHVRARLTDWVSLTPLASPETSGTSPFLECGERGFGMVQNEIQPGIVGLRAVVRQVVAVSAGEVRAAWTEVERADPSAPPRAGTAEQPPLPAEVQRRRLELDSEVSGRVALDDVAQAEPGSPGFRLEFEADRPSCYTSGVRPRHHASV